LPLPISTIIRCYQIDKRTNDLNPCTCGNQQIRLHSDIVLAEPQRRRDRDHMHPPAQRRQRGAAQTAQAVQCSAARCSVGGAVQCSGTVGARARGSLCGTAQRSGGTAQRRAAQAAQRGAAQHPTTGVAGAGGNRSTAW